MKSLKSLINDRLMISIRQFSQDIGISRQTICNIMADKGTPTVLTVKKVCAYFNENYKEYIE